MGATQKSKSEGFGMWTLVFMGVGSVIGGRYSQLCGHCGRIYRPCNVDCLCSSYSAWFFGKLTAYSHVIGCKN